jgi:EAL domain-containing protein (putative c-di-GMP-specific phosphodiesterase class I)
VSSRTHRDDGDLLDARYRPVLERSTGRVVGAELLAPSRAPELLRRCAQAFAFGPAADEGWWLAAALPPGDVASPTAARTVAQLLHRSGLSASRLVLSVTVAELDHAVRTGAASDLASLGVRLSLAGFGLHHGAVGALHHAAVGSLQVSLAGLDRRLPGDLGLLRSVVSLASSCGVAVVGRDVETHEQLELAGEAGVELVTGYWWGSPGSLAKLVATWARQPISG